MSNIAVCGIAGRMGRAIFNILLEKEHNLAAAFEWASSPLIGTESGKLINRDDITLPVTSIGEHDFSGLDGIIDFSAPGASLEVIEKAAARNIPVVIGTTGFTEESEQMIHDAATKVPILLSPNMSIGVNLLFRLTELASKALGNEYDIEILESHHRFKKDAPSGTAKRLLEIVKKNVPELEQAKEISGRDGIIDERSDNEIGVFAMRGGDIVGEHTVYYIGMEERIELTHRASKRETFARGAVLGISFLIGKKPGLYNMYDVLGI